MNNVNLQEQLQDAQREAAKALVLAKMQDARDSRRGVTRGTVVQHRGATLFQPAKFWAGSVVDGHDIETVEAGLKLAAAKLQAGDTTFVFESGLGQVAWLSALALELEAKSKQPGLSASAADRYLGRAMQAQGAAAKLALSLAALAQMGEGGTVVGMGE